MLGSFTFTDVLFESPALSPSWFGHVSRCLGIQAWVLNLFLMTPSVMSVNAIIGLTFVVKVVVGLAKSKSKM